MKTQFKTALASFSTIISALFMLLVLGILVLTQLPNTNLSFQMSSSTQMIINGTVTGFGGTVPPFLEYIIEIVGSALGAALVKLLLDYLGNSDWRKRHGENHTPVVTLP